MGVDNHKRVSYPTPPLPATADPDDSSAARV